jgi:hypothetical protein
MPPGAIPRVTAAVTVPLTITSAGTATEVVRRYLDETGLSVEAALQAHRIENAPLDPLGTDKLTPAERRTLKGIAQTLEAARAWITGLALQGAMTSRPPRPARVPAREAATLAAALKSEALLADPRAVRLEGGGVDVWSSALVISPTLGELVKRQHALHEKCLLSPDELRERLAAELTRPDGTRAPSPSEWCAARGESLTRFITALFEAWWALGTQRLEEELAKARKREKKRKLPDHMAIPQKLLDAGYRPGVAVNLLNSFKNGDLKLGGDYSEQEKTLAVLQRSPEVRAPQLGKLTTPQVRTLLGVFRLVTVGDDDGKLRSDFTVPASMMWHAVNLVGSVSDAQRRTHFAALVDMSRLRLRWTATIETEKGSAVMGGECPPFEVRPIWSATEDGRRGYTPAAAQQIAEAWNRNTGPWTGPLPNEFYVTIPVDMRAVDRRLVLSGNLLEKLEDGARKVRGPTETFAPIDWTLWITITQTVQRPHNGRAFVDVAQVLASVYEAEKVAAQRRKGKLRGPSGYLTQYEKAVQVLEAGGLARRVVKDHATTKGARRDVFEIIKGNVLTKREIPPAAPFLPGLEVQDVK